LEKELGLALIEQGNSSSASAPTSPRPHSAEAPQDETQSRERTETTTGSKPEELQEELQDVSRHGTAQGLEEWEQQETEVVVEGGGVAMQQEQLAAQKEELAQPAVAEGDQQDLVEVIDADDPKDKEATKALPATQPEIDNHHFRLRGIRTQQLAERQAKTTYYRVVCGEYPNRSYSWANEDDIRLLMLRPSCERPSRDLVPQEEQDVRVHRMRCSRRSKGRKVFEYLVNEPSTWITEDQLRISLSPVLVAVLKGN
jgi:hypothetical protein